MATIDRKNDECSVGWTICVLCSVFLAGTYGCTTLPRYPVPVDQIENAEVIGIPGVRATRGEYRHWLHERILRSTLNDPPENYRSNPDGSRSYDYLALSGGGPNGAFGAGFLYGWSQTGTRPNFKLVSGISTGALIAPFAFVGPEYDEVLKEIYTTLSSEDVFKEKSTFAVLWSESLVDSTPLARTIKKYMDEPLLKAVARAHRSGRRLFIGTTNLDAEELVVWSMGAIAASGHVDALKLFRKVMLASTSIPVMMPPVLINVDVHGKRYDEMHVDGNTTNSAFFSGGLVNIHAMRGQLESEGIRAKGGQLYVIQNGQLSPQAAPTPRKFGKIIERSLSTLLRAGRRGDLHRLYIRSQTAQVGFNYVAIPDDYEVASTEHFDPDDMQKLFELGVRMGGSGTAWRSSPPGFEAHILRLGAPPQ